MNGHSGSELHNESKADQPHSPERSSNSLAGLAFGAAFFLVAAWMTIVALDFGSQARRLPLVIGIPLTFMATLNLMKMWLVRRKDGHHRKLQSSGGHGEKKQNSDAGTEGERLHVAPTQPDGYSLAATLLTVGAAAAVFYAVGMVIATLIFNIGFMVFVGGEPWRKTLIATAAIMLLLFSLHNFLGVHFSEGALIENDMIPDIRPF